MLLAASTAAVAMAPSAWLARGRASGRLKLGLLPFLLEHAMLPGETRDVFLFDDSLRQCIQAAATSHGVVGGLLFDEHGRHSELANLFRIDQLKADSCCTWVSLSCMGRCVLCSASPSGVRRNKKHGYRVASVSLFNDRCDSTASLHTLRAAHARVAAQRRQLRRQLLDSDQFDGGTWESLASEAGRSVSREVSPGRALDSTGVIIVDPSSAGTPPFGVYNSYEAYEETGVLEEHVYVGRMWDLGELDDRENGAELTDLVATRRRVLVRSEGADVERTLMESMGGLWEVGSEEEAEVQLLSFAAAATLSPLDRAEALMVVDTTKRLELAEQALGDQHELLAGLLNGPAAM
jgi:hypothetical protein